MSGRDVPGDAFDDDYGDEPYEGDQLVLSDLVNRVLDRGVLLHGTVIISIADIDLVRLDLSLVLRAIETEMRGRRGPPDGPRRIGSGPNDDDLPLLPGPAGD